MESFNKPRVNVYSERQESVQPVFVVVQEIAKKIGNSPESRREWLLNQNAETLKNLLISINQSVREDSNISTFDGDSVQAGVSGLGIIPPDAQDKLFLLDQVPTLLNEKTKQDIEGGVETKQSVEEMIGSLAIFLNQLHLFEDGNGRTTRLLKVLLCKGDAIALTDIETAILKTNANETIDTSPRAAVKQVVFNAIRNTSMTDKYMIEDDVATDDDFLDSTNHGINTKFPNIPPQILSMYIDSGNFTESAARLCKEQGIEFGQVKLSTILTMCMQDPALQEKLENHYKDIRKEIALLSFKASLGLIDIELAERNQKPGERSVRDYNRNRALLD